MYCTRLLGSEVEERFLSLHGQKRLRLIETHGGTQPAVQLEDNRLLEESLTTTAPKDDPAEKAGNTASCKCYRGFGRNMVLRSVPSIGYKLGTISLSNSNLLY